MKVIKIQFTANSSISDTVTAINKARLANKNNWIQIQLMLDPSTNTSHTYLKLYNTWVQRSKCNYTPGELFSSNMDQKIKDYKINLSIGLLSLQNILLSLSAEKN